MTAAERELIEMIRNTEDPEKALEVATDIIIRFLISENLVDDLVDDLVNDTILIRAI